MLIAIVLAAVGLLGGGFANVKLGNLIDRALGIGVSQTYGLDILIIFWLPLVLVFTAIGAVGGVAFGAGTLWPLVSPFICGAMVHAVFVAYALLYRLFTGRKD